MLLDKNRSQDDYQKFCMIRDRLNLSLRMEEMNAFCAICKQRTHIERDCPVVHFVPDKEAVIKRYVFPQK
jgi:hypothetical protein